MGSLKYYLGCYIRVPYVRKLPDCESSQAVCPSTSAAQAAALDRATRKSPQNPILGLEASMYIYIYIDMCVYIYICTYRQKCVCVYVCMYVYIYIYILIDTCLISIAIFLVCVTTNLVIVIAVISVNSLLRVIITIPNWYPYSVDSCLGFRLRTVWVLEGF